MYHNIPNLLVGDLEDVGLIKCLNVCLSEWVRGLGGKRVDGTEMQFVKDAKATQYKVVA